MTSLPSSGRSTSGTAMRAVGLLVVLHDGDERAADGHAGAVQRVHEARPLLGAEAGVEPPRLVVRAVAAAGELPVALLAREPRLAVELLRRRGAEVAGGDVHHLVRDAEALQDRLLGREDHQVLGRALLRRAEAEHLDLVELVHAQDAARVAAGGAGLAAEAGRIACVADRERGLVEELLHVHRRQRDLAGADEAVAVHRLVDLGAVGGEEAGAVHGLLAHEHGRDHRAEALALDDGRARS